MVRYFAAVLSRLRAVFVVMVVVAGIGALPSLAPVAHAAPVDVTVATYDLEPFVFTNGEYRSGFTIDLLDEIAKRANWTVNYVGVNEQSSPGLLEAVRSGRADAAACAISVTAERAETVDFSQPMMSAGLQILVPADTTERTQPGLTDFLKLLFSKTMLVWLFAALVLTILPAHIIWFLERRDAETSMSKSYFPGIFQAFEWGLGMMAAAPVNEPRRWLTRTVSVLWTFVSIIFVAYYTAILTANLTVEKFDAQIRSPEDLVGKKACTVADTTTASYLASIGVQFSAMQSITDCFSGMTERKVDAVVFDAPILQYYLSENRAGESRLVGPVFKPRDYGIAFPIGSALRRQVDDALLSIREDGTYDRVKQKWFGDDG